MSKKYQKWIWKNETWHNLQVLMKYVLTRRFTKRFFCDGHIRLCRCCLKIRGYKFPRRVNSHRGSFMVF